MKRTLLFFGIAVCASLTLAAVLWLQWSNDHKECSTVRQQKRLRNGEVVTTQVHHCKEKFNL